MSAAYDNVNARYERIIRQNERILEQKRAEAYQKAPALEELEASLLALNLERVQTALITDDSGKTLDAVKKRISEAEAKIKSLLKENGFDASHLDPVYTCTKCQDTGYIDAMTKCTCFHRYLLEERVKESGLNADSGTFEAFNADVFGEQKTKDGITQKQYMTGLKKRAEAFADSIPDGKAITFIMMGNTGTGKTFLAEAILNRALKNGQIGTYITANRLFSDFHKHRLGEDVDIDLYHDIPVMAIDDLGTEVMTRNVTEAYFYNLINERMIRGRITVIATNLEPAIIKERYGDRTYSRLFSKQSEKYLIPAEFTDIRK